MKELRDKLLSLLAEHKLSEKVKISLLKNFFIVNNEEALYHRVFRRLKGAKTWFVTVEYIKSTLKNFAFK